jgi:tRNA dimethylallyltransferase
MWRMPLTGKLPPLIVILGPTAVGKTKLSIELAQRLHGEIIGADSRQIYRYMDIGTAKPSPEEQTQVPHHLIDFVDPDYNLTVAEYQDLAYQKINDLHNKNKLPFLVGGTGQYISAVAEGWSIPRVPPNPEIRAELEAYVVEYDAQALHEQLQKVDMVSAEKIHPNNVRRVIRALEVYKVTGEPISKLQEKKPPPYRILTLGLKLDRDILYPLVDARVDNMIEQGFIEEVQKLLDLGYSRALPSMSGLGYLEIAEHLLDNAPLDEAIQKTKFSTHNFIRRQDVWFRGHDNGILWHNVEEIDVNNIEQSICDWLEG